jgi:hypothetical protein
VTSLRQIAANRRNAAKSTVHGQRVSVGNHDLRSRSQPFENRTCRAAHLESDLPVVRSRLVRQKSQVATDTMATTSPHQAVFQPLETRFRHGNPKYRPRMGEHGSRHGDGQLNSTQHKSALHGPGDSTVPTQARSLLGAEASARLRDRLLAQINLIGSSDDSANISGPTRTSMIRTS